MYPKLKKLIVIAVVSVSLFGKATLVTAAQPDCPSLGDSPSFAEVLRRTACKAGFISSGDTETIKEENIVSIIGQFISIVLGFTGVVFVVLILYGGWLWGTARGNEEQVQSAEKLIRNAVIGVIIVFATFTISRFVINAINVSFAP